MGRKKESHFKGKVNKSKDRMAGGVTFAYLSNPKDFPFFKPTPGDDNCQLDFIPYIVTDKNHPEKEEDGTAIKGSQWFKRGFRVHHKVGTDKRSIVCPTSWGGKCPICDKRQELWEAKAPKEDQEKLYTSLRYLYIVIPLKSEGKEKKKVHIMDISNHAFEKMRDAETKTNEDYETHMDLENGLTLKCRWSKEAFDAKSKPWAKIARIDFLEREKQYDEKMLKKVPNLDELFIKLSYDDIDKMFNEVEDVDETIDDTKNRKKKGNKKTDKKKKKQKAPDCPNGLTFAIDYMKKKKKCKACEIKKVCEKVANDDLPF